LKKDECTMLPTATASCLEEFLEVGKEEGRPAMARKEGRAHATFGLAAVSISMFS
jgi:hypothetical protein